MKHLRIYEDYFGREDYVDKRDLNFFEELFDYLDGDWNYNKEEYSGSRAKEKPALTIKEERKRKLKKINKNDRFKKIISKLYNR